MSKRYGVTVVLLTYNHEHFIGQALEGVLMQETTFPVDIVVVEDCSTDRTRGIAEEIARRHEDRVTIVSSDTNRGDYVAFSQAIVGARGCYVAILDGDDYWTSPEKLQTQVDFLDSHGDCSMCFHNVAMAYEDGSTGRDLFNPLNQPRFSTVEDLWERNFIATCSVMFRQGLIARFPMWYQQAKWGDWPLHILNAEHGRIGYIDSVMAVYRVHASGVWSKLSDVEKLKEVIDFYLYMDKGFEHRYARHARAGIARHRRLLVRTYLEGGDRGNARAQASQYIRDALKARSIPRGISVTQLLYLYAPLFHGLLSASTRPFASALRKVRK